MITKKIFAQIKPTANVAVDLYTVPVSNQAKGTIYISTEQGSHEKEWVSVQLVPATYKNQPLPGTVNESNTYIMSGTVFWGQVPIYLQQICLNSGDAIKVLSQRGTCQFTYLGDLYEP